MKERDILTVDLFPEKTPFPKFTPEECLKQTAEDMLHLLKLSTASPTAAPLSFGPPILNLFAKVANILGRAVAPPPPPPPATPQPTVEPVEHVPLHSFTSTSEGADHTCPCCTSTSEGAYCHTSITGASYFYKETINETQKCFFSFSDFQLSSIKSTIWHLTPSSEFSSSMQSW
jgi:hypothetical protein